jgi:hypothetical protein
VVTRLSALVAGFALLAGPLTLVLAPGCSNPAALLGKGGQCLQTTDCQDGLFCVPQKNGTKTCSNNLAAIVSTEEAGAMATKDAAAGDSAARDGAAVPEGGPGGDAAPTRDAGVVPEASSTDAPAAPDDAAE